MNFFKFVFLVRDWTNKPAKFDFFVFEIVHNKSANRFKIKTKDKAIVSSLNEFLNTGQEAKIFPMLKMHMESLRALFKIKNPLLNLKTVGQNPVTGLNHYWLIQLSPICWELRLNPFNKFLKKHEMYKVFFSKLRWRLDEEMSGFFLFNEYGKGEELREFYKMFAEDFEMRMDSQKNILKTYDFDCDRTVRFFEYLISFLLTRTNIFILYSYVD